MGFYGHVRATNDIDVWIGSSSENALKAEAAIREFGFDLPSLSAQKLIEEGKITRMGNPPMRIEVLNSISGVEFLDAYEKKVHGHHRRVEDTDDLSGRSPDEQKGLWANEGPSGCRGTGEVPVINSFRTSEPPSICCQLMWDRASFLPAVKSLSSGRDVAPGRDSIGMNVEDRVESSEGHKRSESGRSHVRIVSPRHFFRFANP